MGLVGVLRREFSFITGNYRILVVSWILMDIAWEMPTPNFQYYVQSLDGTGIALNIIGFANFFGMAAVAFSQMLLIIFCGVIFFLIVYGIL